MNTEEGVILETFLCPWISYQPDQFFFFFFFFLRIGLLFYATTQSPMHSDGATLAGLR